MEKLNNFIETSDTFSSFEFVGNYSMGRDLFLRFFGYYNNTGINLLDDYSNHVYLSWMKDNEMLYDIDKIIKIETSLSRLRKSKLVDSYDLADQREKMRRLRANYSRWIESKHKKKGILKIYNIIKQKDENKWI